MKFGNPKKRKFIENFPETSIVSNDIKGRCKFNFSFFEDSQAASSSFHGLPENMLAELMEKLKGFSRNPLNYWRHQRCGKGGLKILTDYDSFPKKSEFAHPKSVPHDVHWGRFRLENMIRLVGFTVPGHLSSEPVDKDGFFYDTNTFYVVFIDLHHKFYITEDR